MAYTSEMLDEEQRHEGKDLERGLKDRHIEPIAIGGALAANTSR